MGRSGKQGQDARDLGEGAETGKDGERSCLHSFNDPLLLCQVWISPVSTFSRSYTLLS